MPEPASGEGRIRRERVLDLHRLLKAPTRDVCVCRLTGYSVHGHGADHRPVGSRRHRVPAWCEVENDIAVPGQEAAHKVMVCIPHLDVRSLCEAPVRRRATEPHARGHVRVARPSPARATAGADR